MKRRKKMNEVMVTMKFKEAEIDIMYESLMSMNTGASMMLVQEKEEVEKLKDALKKIKQRIHNEKEKAKQEHKEG